MGHNFFEKRRFPKMAGYASPLILSGVNSLNLKRRCPKKYFFGDQPSNKKET
tara:strand:+ start:122 stop:277 length:156 start_codon:yes stop_codon:yes gene_type:complete